MECSLSKPDSSKILLFSWSLRVGRSKKSEPSSYILDSDNIWVIIWFEANFSLRDGITSEMLYYVYWVVNKWNLYKLESLIPGLWWLISKQQDTLPFEVAQLSVQYVRQPTQQTTWYRLRLRTHFLLIYSCIPIIDTTFVQRSAGRSVNYREVQDFPYGVGTTLYNAHQEKVSIIGGSITGIQLYSIIDCT